MKQEPRQLGYLPLEVIQNKIPLPSKERMEEGPVVII